MNYKNGIAYVNFLANNYNNQNVVPATIPVAMTAVTVGGTAITNAYTPIVKR
jgi:hypothetical protein